MLVEVTLSLAEARRPTYTRKLFWSEFRRLTGGPDFDDERSSSAAEFSRAEEIRLQQEFARILASLINGSATRERARSGIERYEIPIELRHISYGSIKFLLDLFGIDNDVMKEQVLLALEAFSPIAFNAVLNSDVDLLSSVRNLTVRPSPDTKKTATRMWSALQTSLLVPVAITLAVLYFAATILQKQSDNLSAERIAYINAVSSRNEALSTALAEDAKLAIATSKAMQELQTSLINTRAESLGLREPGPKPAKEDQAPNGKVSPKD